MTNRRMFSLKVVDTDSFLDMSPTAQNLYFHLGMRADDDGFVPNPKKIIKFVNAADDDMKVLIAKGFIIPMATSGICVISHWKINNLIKSDRYTETIYLEEKSRLEEKNGVYGFYYGEIEAKLTNGSRSGTQMVPEVEPQVRLGKDSIGKDKNIVPLTVDMDNLFQFFLEKSGFKRVLLTPMRKKKIQARLKTFSLDEIKEAITHAYEDSFYSGDNDRSWKADIDYIFRSDEIIDRLLNIQPRQNQRKEADPFVFKD